MTTYETKLRKARIDSERAEFGQDPIYSTHEKERIEATEPEIRASIFTVEQEQELRRLKAYFPFRIVWGEVIPDTQAFSAFASSDRRALNKSLRAGNLVATIQ